MDLMEDGLNSGLLRGKYPCNCYNIQRVRKSGINGETRVKPWSRGSMVRQANPETGNWLARRVLMPPPPNLALDNSYNFILGRIAKPKHKRTF